MTNNTHLPFTASCPTCDFTSSDIALLQNHSCDIQQNGGYCEDFPCCGHEAGDCNGLKYGSDESIKEFWTQKMTELDDWELADLQDRMDANY